MSPQNTLAILFEPHLDDAVLFACWTVLGQRPLVVSVLADSHLQDSLGVSAADRLEESFRAFTVLGVDWDPWPFRDDRPDWDGVSEAMERLRIRFPDAHVYAPAAETDGNNQHSEVGLLALAVFGKNVSRYTTYTGAPGVKTVTNNEVPFKQEWIGPKLQALACYGSQHTVRSGAFRFFVNDLREYRP